MKRNSRRRGSGLVSGLCLLLLWCGCEPRVERSVDADRIEILSGDNQMGFPLTELEPLTVRVLGPRRVDFLGRKRERRPVVGVPVTFKVDDLTKKRFENLQEGIEEAESEDSGEGGVAEDSGEPISIGDADEAPTTLHPLLYEYRSEEKSPAPNPPVGSDSIIAETDRDGVARANVRLGTLNGAWRVEARIEKKGEKVHFRLISGIEGIFPDGREAHVGAEIPLRVELKEWHRGAGIGPIAGRDVVFRIVDEPSGARGTADLKDRRNDTDSKGFRHTEISLGERPGVYRVLAEVLSEETDRWPWRGVVFTVLATDWIGLGFQFFAGVLLFVIGVRLLGSGGLLLASPYMHLPIGPWARNRVHGFLGGVVAGTVFQSSSLVTSYVTSLSNSGLLKATGALGLILGANVGGTVLCQILALDVDVLAAPLLLIGTLLFMARRRTPLGSWAWIFVGSGLVLFSWDVLYGSVQTAAMSDAFKRIAALPNSPTRWLVYFALAGLGSFFLRTSNLVVVLTMLLLVHQVLAPAAAVPLVLGANLGAAVMVFVLTRTKRREPRRVALLNLLFQLFGCATACVVGLILIDRHSLILWVVDAIVPGTLLSPLPANIPQHVATVHTMYNLVMALVFLCFPAALYRPLERIMPQSTVDAVKPIHLDENLRNVPALALRQTTAEVVYMTEICRKAVAESFDAFRYDDLDLSEQVVRREQVISDMHREVSRYLVEVCENQLAHHDATQLEILQSAAESVARIGVSAENLRELASRKLDEKVTTPEDIDRDLGEVYDLVMGQFGNILTLLDERDPRTEENAVKLVERLAKYSSRIHAHWRQGTGDESPKSLPASTHQQLIIYQEAFSILFGIAANLGHIAQRMRILAPER